MTGKTGASKAGRPHGDRSRSAKSTAQAFTGTHAIAINVPGGAAAWPAVDNQTGPFPGLAGGKTITYAVWSPSASEVSVTPFVYDQSWWANFGTGVNLAQGWNLVTFTVPTSVITFNGVGLQINNGTGWGGTLYLDTVGWS